MNGEAPHRVKYLPRNCRAPFDGQLLENDLAAEMAADRALGDERLRLVLTATGAYWRERLRHNDAMHEADRQGWEQKEGELRDEVEAVRPEWYEHPAVVAGVTLSLVLVVAAVLASALEREEGVSRE